MIDEQERVRITGLVAVLSPDLKTAAEDFGAQLTKGITVFFAEEHDKLRRLAAQRSAELTDDLKVHREQHRVLQDKIEKKDTVIAELEAENYELAQQLAAQTDKNAALLIEIATLKSNRDVEDQFLCVLESVIAKLNIGAASPIVPQQLPG